MGLDLAKDAKKFKMIFTLHLPFNRKAAIVVEDYQPSKEQMP